MSMEWKGRGTSGYLRKLPWKIPRTEADTFGYMGPINTFPEIDHPCY